ncbi:MAG TPA: hypothetical protein VMK82_07280, partial [Steroidobacteraceae bacterium]|nr:hypothetical protein [Steroidobacteraceae bacterium]
MNARPQLDHYLSQARRRLRFILSAKGAALLAATLLAITLIAAWWLPRYGFSDQVALLGRVALGVAAAGVALWWWLNWREQERARGAAALEQALPAQSGRIATYLQESAKEPGKASVLLDLLAADTLAVAEREALQESIRTRRILRPALAAVAAVAVLGAMFFVGGSLSEGAR